MPWLTVLGKALSACGEQDHIHLNALNFTGKPCATGETFGLADRKSVSIYK